MSTDAAVAAPSQSISPWWQDKALWVTVLSFLLPFLSKAIGVDLDPVKVAAFIIPVVVFIIGHKIKSAAIVLAEIKAKVALELGPPPTTASSAAAALNKLGTGT